jgi:hypothetical protein
MLRRRVKNALKNISKVLELKPRDENTQVGAWDNADSIRL